MNTELNSYIESLNLKYKATFIPFSASRNSEEKTPTINWVCTIEKNGKSLKVEYSQGTGHLPKHVQNMGTYAQKQACENGRGLKAPKIADILYCLVLDSDVSNYSDYQDWAESFGYDPDSIKGLEVYKACLKQASQFSKVFTAGEREKLAELFQDY